MRQGGIASGAPGSGLASLRGGGATGTCMCLTPPVGETSTSTPVELDLLAAEGAVRAGGWLHGSIGKWLLLDGRGFSVSAAGEASRRFGMLASGCASLRSLERLRPELGRSGVLFQPPQSSSLVGEGASGSTVIF